MNLLEHYIKGIISESHIQMYNKDWVEAKMIINCYGIVEERTELFLYEDWKKIKKKGYYMA